MSANPPVSGRNRVAVQIAAASMTTAGEVMKGADENQTGTDDVAGSLLSLGGKALQRLTRNDERGFRRYLREVRDSITEYLEEEE